MNIWSQKLKIRAIKVSQFGYGNLNPKYFGNLVQKFINCSAAEVRLPQSPFCNTLKRNYTYMYI